MGDGMETEGEVGPAEKKCLPEEPHNDIAERYMANLRDVEQSLSSQMREMRHSFEKNIEAAAASAVTQKQTLEVVNAKLRVVEQRTIRHTSELKAITRAVDKHGLAEDMEPLQQQLLEARAFRQASTSQLENLHEVVHDNIARLNHEVERLGAVSLDAVELELARLQSQLADFQREHGHFLAWARPVLSEGLTLPSQVREMSTNLTDLRSRQNRCEDEVNKILRLGRILDDKVEVFDDLQRRMEELNTSAQKVLGSHSAASVRCLSCKDKEEETRAPSPVRTVVNHQFEIQANPTRPRRPQSAGARLEVRAEEKAKTAPDSGPRRGNFVAGKQGPVVGIRGIAITAWRGAKSRTPMPAHPPRRRPQSARACLQSGPTSESLAIPESP